MKTTQIRKQIYEFIKLYVDTPEPKKLCSSIEDLVEELAESKVKNLALPNVSGSAYICQNVNGEEAIVFGYNIADVFDKLEDICPNSSDVKVAGKSTPYYR